MEATGTQTVLETPLTALHRAGGAKLGVWFGSSLPDDFGDWEREYGFAKQTVALVDKNYGAYISFLGPDRARYLNAILTNNIKDLQPGQGNASLLLNPQGRILAEIEVHAQADKLFCISHAMIREQLIETLDKFIIMDDVTLADDTQRLGMLALEGPSAARLLQKLAGFDLNSLADFASADVRIESAACMITRRTLGDSAVVDLLTEREHLEALWETLAKKTRAAGGGAVGFRALNALRLEQGVAWFGYDFGEKQIPHEAGLQDSHISYTKGCYTGQEIVERVRSRGQVNRRRVQLRFKGDRVAVSGDALTAGGKEVGAVTSASALPSQDFAIGMGYLRKENATPGSIVDWSGGTATVVR